MLKGFRPNTTKEYDWIREYIGLIPSDDLSRQSIFDLAGISHLETISSNLIANFLEKNDRVALSQLFASSLLDVISKKLHGPKRDRIRALEKLLRSDYDVKRECSTRRGRIDILITPPGGLDEDSDGEMTSCALIIENKIHAPTDNPFDDYWESVNAEHKLGVILSLDREPQTDGRYLDIHHEDLLNSVLNNIGEYYLEMSTRDLAVLQEYLLTISNLCSSLEETAMEEEQLYAFYRRDENGSNIWDLIEADKSLRKYLNRQLDKAFQEFEYLETDGGDGARNKHYMLAGESKNPIGKEFRFWIDVNKLQYDSNLEGAYEMYGKYDNELIESIQSTIRSSIRTPPGVKMSYRSGKNWAHIFTFMFPVDYEANDTTSLSDALIKILHKMLMVEDGLVAQVCKAYESARSLENSRNKP